MLNDLDVIMLTKDIPSYGLKRGDVGAIVDHYREATPATYEVEFVTAQGDTIAVLTLTAGEVQPLRGSQILHARDWKSVISSLL